MRRPPLVVVVVQNLALPGDRRVWLQCQTLRDAGYRVVGITPKAANDPGYALHEGVHLYKYRPPRTAEGAVSFVWEFLYCWLATFALTLRVMAKHGRAAVLQCCNPPDTFFALALLLRPLRTKFVYDQHDLCPELYESRFGRTGRAHRALLWLERRTYRSADKVIVTNESYRKNAMARGGVAPSEVTVVRTGPDVAVLHPRAARPDLRRGRTYLVHFHGVMGPQDSVDIVVRTAEIFRAQGRTDTFFNVLGHGDTYDRLRRRVAEAGLDDMVHMPGRVSDEELFDSMATATAGLSPDLPSPLNDVSTMNKTMEYMAFGLPGVSFDLKEARVSAQASSVYVLEPTAEAFAAATMALLDDEAGRAVMSELALQRVRDELAWSKQAAAYLGVYAAIAPVAPTGAGA